MNSMTTSHHSSPLRSGIFAALVSTCTFLLVGCGGGTIHPAYKPSAILKQMPASGNISLRVVDKIENTAPLAQQVSASSRAAKVVVFGGVLGGSMRDVDTGQQLVSAEGPHKLDATPAIVAHRVFKAALERSGFRVVDNAPDVLEVQLLRLEIIVTTKKGEYQMKIAGNVLHQASLQRGGQSFGETKILEQGDYNAGLVLSFSELEAFVSELLSKAAEHALVDEKLTPTLNQLRGDKP
jgi:hypothetical protein